jgi:hypothetical protein
MRSTTQSFLAGLLLAMVPASVFAAPITVTLETAGLPAGNYLFDFQFINGDGSTGNNTATISEFSSTNLTLGALSTFGTVTGVNLTSGLTLTDGPVTEVDQAFTASASAASVSFLVDYSVNYVAPGPGDTFSFAITDTSLNSTRSTGDGAELEIDITGPNSPVDLFPADSAFGGFQPGIAGGVTTPEPATLALSAGGLFLLGLFVLRRATARFPARSGNLGNLGTARVFP